MAEYTTKTTQRWTAYKVCIREILDASLMQDNPQGFSDNKKRILYRVNVIATLVERIDNPSLVTLYIEDATGRITVRCFEPEKMAGVQSGDMVLCIGRIREFNNERYIIAEIIKPVQQSWAQLRQHEIQPLILTKEIETERVNEDVETQYLLVLNAIQELDTGNGADYKDVLGKVKAPITEKTINRLLELGEIFEIKPGRFKVLT